MPLTPAIGADAEADVLSYLQSTPTFFERHAQLLASVQITSPHGQRAVSLQERQLEVMRERIRGLEHKIVEMVRHGQENMAITERVHRWSRAVMATARAADVPDVLVAQLQTEFIIPQAALRLWGVQAAHTALPFAQGATADVKIFADSLSAPYCGANAGFEAAGWLQDSATVASLAMIPLHHGGSTVGLLVVGSPDPTRFGADMGTEFLSRIGELASAGLSRLFHTRD
jgi:uncharacterized protein